MLILILKARRSLDTSYLQKGIFPRLKIYVKEGRLSLLSEREKLKVILT